MLIPRCACAEQVQNSKNRHISTATVRANNQRSIASIAVSADQQEAAVPVKAIVPANVPLTFIENHHLVNGLKQVGVSLPSHKQLANKYTPELAAEAEATTSGLLSKMPLIGASSDGWSKKYYKDGNALMNIVALTLDKAYFHDAINVSDMRKHSNATVAFLKRASKDLVGPREDDVGRLV